MTKPTFKPTVFILSAYAGEDTWNETTPGRTEGQAYWDIRQGQVENVSQVILVDGAKVEDITVRIAEKIAANLEDGECVSTSAAEFAEEHGGYVRKLTRAEREANRADYINDCRKADCFPFVAAFAAE